MEGLFVVFMLMLVLLVALVLALAFLGARTVVQQARRHHTVQQYQHRVQQVRATGYKARSAMDKQSDEFVRRAYHTLRR